MVPHQPTRKPSPPAAAAASEIPDKLYFRIGEVARLCDVPTYVLRFWESEFPQLKPNKGGTGQRLFRRRDVEMALHIRHLLYDEGYTIPGARQLLRGEAKGKEPQLTLLAEDPGSARERDGKLRRLRSDLQALLSLLDGSPAGPATPSADPIRFHGRRGGASSTPVVRRSPANPVVANENLFDFPAITPGRGEEAEIPEDVL